MPFHYIVPSHSTVLMKNLHMPNPYPSSKKSNVLKVVKQILLTMIKSEILPYKLAYFSMVMNLMWPNFFELAAGFGNSAVQQSVFSWNIVIMLKSDRSWVKIYGSSVGWFKNTSMSTQPICHLYLKKSK